MLCCSFRTCALRRRVTYGCRVAPAAGLGLGFSRAENEGAWGIFPSAMYNAKQGESLAFGVFIFGSSPGLFIWALTWGIP